jgi:hypothetical protein
MDLSAALRQAEGEEDRPQGFGRLPAARTPKVSGAGREGCGLPEARLGARAGEARRTGSPQCPRILSGSHMPIPRGLSTT